MNFDDRLFDTPAEIAAANVQTLAIARANFPDIDRRFGPASFGNHEAMDRTWMLLETFDAYVVQHPSVALCPEAFAMATHARSLMAEVYRIIGRFEADAR